MNLYFSPKARRAALTGFMAGALLLSGCEKKPPTDALLIGLGGPITGPNAKFGEQLLKGARMAAEVVNEQGGINGKQVFVVPADDACEAKQARSVANRLVNEGVAAVIGHFCSSSTIPASEVYAERNLLMITPGSTNPQVTDKGFPTVFRTCGRDDQQGSVAADYIAAVLKPKALAVIHDKDTYGQGLADAMRARLKQKHHMQEILYEGITRGDKDFNSLITKMKGLKVDVIFFGGVATEGGLLVRQATEQGLKARFVSGDGIITENFPAITGPAVKGVLMTFGQDPRLIPQAAAVVDRFRKSGYDPEAYTLYSYASAQVIFEALKNTGNTHDGKVLAAYIRAHTFDTVMGPKAFDAKGDLKQSDYVMFEWVETEPGKYAYQQISR